MKKTHARCPTCGRNTDFPVTNAIGTISCPTCVGTIEEEVARIATILPGVSNEDEQDVIESVTVGHRMISSKVVIFQHWYFRLERWFKDPPKEFDHRIGYHGRYRMSGHSDVLAVGEGRCYESAWKNLVTNLDKMHETHKWRLEHSAIGDAEREAKRLLSDPKEKP